MHRTRGTRGRLRRRDEDARTSGVNRLSRALRSMLAGATLAAALAGCGGGGDGPDAESRQVPTAYPDITDTSHATLRAANIFTGFFDAKSLHQAAPMVEFFAPRPDPVAYLDAGLGFEWASQDALLEVWSGDAFANGPPTALSYPLRVIGDERSAVVEFVDTPELLGREFRFLASVTFDADGRIVRWVDYWDGRSSQLQLPIGTLGPYPADFRDDVSNASARIEQVAQALQAALQAGDAAAAADLFSADALLEDMALHARLDGRIQIQRYFERGMALLPYGTGAALLHVAGSDQGGGYEWRAVANAAPLVRGITALELDADGRVTRFTTIYDSFQLSDDTYDALVGLAAEPEPAPAPAP